MKTEWDVESAIATYNVEGWGNGYFTINSLGNVEAKPLKENGGCIDLLEVVNEARARSLGFPLVIRFQDLLRHRVESVNRAFQTAITESTQASNFILDSKRAANRNWLPRWPCTKTRRV